jgi:hypothetical protein
VPCVKSGRSPSFCISACTETPGASRSITCIAAPRNTTRSTIAGTRLSPAEPCGSIRIRSGLITACAVPVAVASQRCADRAQSPSRIAAGEPAEITSISIRFAAPRKSAT